MGGIGLLGRRGFEASLDRGAARLMVLVEQLGYEAIHFLAQLILPLLIQFVSVLIKDGFANQLLAGRQRIRNPLPNRDK